MIPCCVLRRVRGTDLAALLVALGGTLAAANMQEARERTRQRGPDRVESCGHAVVPVSPLDACVRGYSSAHSGAAHLVGAEGIIEPALLQQACELAGDTSCEVGEIIPRETALCVAEQALFGEGRARSAVLGWHARAGEAVWTVAEGSGAPDSCLGRLVTVAAETGQVLEVSGPPGC